MPIERKVQDIMIPIEKYATIGPDATLQDAILSLRRSFCKLEKGFCEETGPRTVLVTDSSATLVGILDFRSILKVLVPEVAGSLSEKLAALEVSVVFAQADAEKLDTSHEALAARVVRNAQVKVKQVMLKSRANIRPDAKILDALKLIFSKKLVVLPVCEGNRLIGVLRDADLFLSVAEMVVP